MILAFFQFADSISWRLGAEDGSLFALPKTPEWLFVTPLFYPQLSPQSQDHFYGMANGKYFCRTSQVVLATKKARSIEELGPDDQFEVLGKIVRELLMRLRHIGGQATIPKFESCFAFGLSEIDDLPILHTPAVQPTTTHFQKYLWETAITGEQIQAAEALGPDYIAPTHEALFLDAVTAHRGGDYRSSILYAAISAEVVLGSVIDREYVRVVKAHDDERFRIIQRSQAGGTSIYKDPIYERLRSRPDFNVLMHELSLYILRRSLLVEDETLYLKAKRLYSTRNKIAHSGSLPERGSIETIAMDVEGSLAALETVVALFSWLNERADFPLLFEGFVPGH